MLYTCFKNHNHGISLILRYQTPILFMAFMVFIWKCQTTNDDIEQATNSKSRNDDQSMIRQALNSVGSSAYGIISISVWSLNEISSHLIQHGFWVDPIFRRESTSDALEMLIDERRMDYAPARPLIPGEGLQVFLFSECINTIRVRTSHIKRSSILFD